MSTPRRPCRAAAESTLIRLSYGIVVNEYDLDKL